MDAIILTAFLRMILTVTTVWNNVETGDIYYHYSGESWRPQSKGDCNDDGDEQVGPVHPRPDAPSVSGHV